MNKTITQSKKQLVCHKELPKGEKEKGKKEEFNKSENSERESREKREKEYELITSYKKRLVQKTHYKLYILILYGREDE